MKKSACKIGGALYVVWGLLHVMAAYKVYALSSAVPDAAHAARIAQAGWNLGLIALFAIAIGAKFNWRNDRLGYWLNLYVVSLTDIGFIWLVLLPGYFPLGPGLVGPALWLLAVFFSTLGRLQADTGVTASPAQHA
ncbi:MAG: hypothetical protein ACE5GZ_05365 [Gammaproteobacteria bacterium]